MRIWHFSQIFIVLTFIVCVTVLLRREGPECDCADSVQKREFEEQLLQTCSPGNFSVRQDALGVLDVPYNYLLGTPNAKKRFLSVGISSVKRQKQNYLLETIDSVFSHLSPEELDEVLLVVFLANHDHSLNLNTAQEIKGKFASAVDAGRLIVVSTSPKHYPLLDGLKRNYNDAPERVKFRSKQNVDYAFLVNFCANLSRFYLMLEDDVSCAHNFLTRIRNSIATQKTSWTTITFSSLGYIGKLYHSIDLPKLARFLLLFYDEMPCDWLLDHFHRSKAQPEIIRVKPSLFQHMGTYSSFQNNQNKLKDKEFMEVVETFGDSPTASCFSNIEAYSDNVADNVCFVGPNFFWGKDVTPSSHFTMVFREPVNLDRVTIITGSGDHPGDILKSGYAQLGRHKVTEDGHETCKDFTNIGDFHDGGFTYNSRNSSAGKSVDCLRVRVSAAQEHWLLIQKIGVWIRK
ncbi:hypothetical protein XENTR_v10010630 [Xenopus tropicalis]|uniref:Alpha-1,3-mannosyl-glycoprotein 4-beta-N-acetylglucosaminyltransferase C n=1 Tax=Xenopus tropicalis TaxID=8364 RepID=A0A803KC45_XENTR|nr:alpha-1,3-mannosyl-glycoprotein 4-beta-N-acetylglucosaminyltransferase C [Xenopus tropicalis]KAE8606195.1 hypothetical protein XENTR_v10010630 [Xenopus tropicalis]KAE8606196.1 hypothetical protein XENTR_v10010630 [Xenopus tropicalis]KAE8606197.1 hypothetical protein XENTR_v10010630 [Xenopus tropicalis]KAE8606198.1 hypothetical protein XENTR_v10010630 [Xenopus tropicalis]KAE8606199.1 hypothetical protein XENTR_v10010630 [Xenopus tropicalis]